MDLFIPEVFINPRNEVYLILKNQGHSPITPRHIDLVIYWDELQVARFDLDTIDPHFRHPRDSSILKLPFLPNGSSHRVMARVDSSNQVSESDEYHNVYLKTLRPEPAGVPAPFYYPRPVTSFDPSAYLALMNTPPFASQVLWYEDHRTYPMAYWRKNWKDRLLGEIGKIYQQTPVNVPDSLPMAYSGEEAFTVFLHYIAHSLYLEKERLVPWSVQDFSSEDLSSLWDARQYFEWDSLYQVYRLGYQNSGATRVYHPLMVYQFARFIQDKPEHLPGSIERFMDWGRAWLLHTERSGMTFFQSIEEILYPGPGQPHAVFSCWATSGLILDYCRALNIPVKRHNIELYNGIHSQIEFPTEGWYLMHADDMYDPLYYPVNTQIPPTAALFNKSDFNLLLRNKPICVFDSCHARGTQISFDRRKALLDQAARLESGYYIFQYDQGRSKFRDFVRGDQFEVFLKPLFTDDEIKARMDQIKSLRPEYTFIENKYRRFEAAKNNRR